VREREREKGGDCLRQWTTDTMLHRVILSSSVHIPKVIIIALPCSFYSHHSACFIVSNAAALFRENKEEEEVQGLSIMP